MTEIVVKWATPHVEIFVDHGFGPRIAASFPTGAYAGYQEARDQNMVECKAKVEAFIATKRKLYPDVTVSELESSE